MNAIEKVRKIREAAREFGPSCDYYILTESEAAALLTDEPSKTAEELAEQVGNILEYDEDCFDYGEQLKKAVALIQSALTAYARAKVEEAADRFCFNGCSRSISPSPGECQISDKCPSRAAILGREVGKPGNDQTCEYCRGTGVISDSIALTKPCPMCSTKQSAHKGEEGRG